MEKFLEIVRMIFICYFVITNISGLVVMGVDKSRAKKHQWRIPEKILFLVSAIGGSAGTLIGMYLFRHKTKHTEFAIGLPMIFIVHILLFVVNPYIFFTY